jgi:hypothetical protein
LVVGLLGVGAPGWAATRAEVASEQVAGLFVGSCVSFAGDVGGLRDWARRIGLPPVPEPGAKGFLKGAAGVVYDASNPSGRLVVLSHDDGGCAVLAEAVDLRALPGAVEAALARAGVAAVFDGEREDLGEAAMRHRTYHAALGGRAWTLVVSYAPKPRQPGLGEAMLSALPR